MGSAAQTTFTSKVRQFDFDFQDPGRIPSPANYESRDCKHAVC
jgi:hypothetical protein